MANQLAGDAQLPGAIVALEPVAPGGERAQPGFAPRRSTDVHDGRISAAQDGREIHDSAAQTLGEPRSILMTPIVDPFGFGPAIGGLREHDRITLAIAQLVRHACGGRILVPSPW